MLVLPLFRSERRETELEQELKAWVKKNYNGWVELPELTELEHLKVNDFMNSNKFVPYTI